MLKQSRTQKNLEVLLKLNINFHRLNRDIEQLLRISLTQTLVLLKLRDLPGITAKGLAHHVGVHPSTLTPMLQRLKKMKYLHLIQDPKDSRKILVALSRTGYAVLQSALIRLTDILGHETIEISLVQSVNYLDGVRNNVNKNSCGYDLPER